MKKLKKLVLFLVFVIAVFLICRLFIHNNVGWHEDEFGRYYIKEVLGSKATGIHEIDENKYLFDKNGYLTKGIEKVWGNTYFVNENGQISYGFVNIGDARYYFDENGIMVYGIQEINRREYYFDNDGKMKSNYWLNNESGERLYYNDEGMLVHGFKTIENEVYYFDNETGTLKIGFQEINGNKYYFNDDGRMVDEVIEISGDKYNFQADGRLFTGWIKEESATYYKNEFGYNVTGFKYIDDKKYYFYGDGKMAKNAMVDRHVIDANGVATVTKATLENLDGELQKILDTTGKSKVAICKYVKNYMTYRNGKKTSIEQMSVDALNNGRGSCFNYAALTYMLFKKAGFDARIVEGYSIHGPDAGVHNWIYSDGLHYDALLGWYGLDYNGLASVYKYPDSWK